MYLSSIVRCGAVVTFVLTEEATISNLDKCKSLELNQNTVVAKMEFDLVILIVLKLATSFVFAVMSFILCSCAGVGAYEACD